MIVNKMKKVFKATLLGLAVLIGFGGQKMQALAFPAILDFLPTAQVAFPKSDVGPDGNNRFLWDYFNISGSTYSGSVLWILNPAGNVIGTGDTMIPASVGAVTSAGIIASFTILHVNADNTTTVAFQFGGGPLLGGTGAQVNAFGTWTYDPQGKLIAASGPTGFNGLQISNLKFQGDFLVVTFIPNNQTISTGVTLGGGPFTVWAVDHFGNLVSAVGNQGPYTNYTLGSVTLSGPSTAPTQLWHWLSASTTSIKLSVQEFSPTGAPLSGSVYGFN